MTKILDEYTSSVINQNQWKTLMQENCNEALMRCTCMMPRYVLVHCSL